MTGLTVIPFGDEHLDEAAGLLAARHRQHRRAEPLLDPRYEETDAARAEIDELWRQEGASGSVCARDGRLTGYLLGVRRGDDPWGPNVWVEGAGHAAERAEDVRDLYALAAAGWVEAGRIAHYAVVPATDAQLVDAWFRLCFGCQHVHGVRETPAPEELPAGVRRPTRNDIPELARLDLVLPRHHRLAPVFSSGGGQTLAQRLEEWEEGFDDPAFANFVAELDGAVVGYATACSVERSSGNAGLLRPPNAGFLGYAALLPEARGRGLGRALGEATMAWAAEQGYSTIAVDWRAVNLLASRAWPGLGFRPSFVRVHRLIGY